MTTTLEAGPADEAAHEGSFSQPDELLTTSSTQGKAPPTDQDAVRAARDPNPAPVALFTAFLAFVVVLSTLCIVGMEAGWFR